MATIAVSKGMADWPGKSVPTQRIEKEAARGPLWVSRLQLMRGSGARRLPGLRTDGALPL